MQGDLHHKVIEWCAKLMREDHFEHEDIIGELQRARDPYSIPFLREAVLLKPRLSYLEYDDYGSYYKKCFWALREIGTPEAIAVIGEFAAAQDSVIREQAAYRLSQIERGH